MSVVKLLQRRWIPARSRWWLTHRRRIASGESFIKSGGEREDLLKFWRVQKFSFLTFQTFIVVYQRRQSRTRVQSNVTEESNTNDLPQQSQDEMRLSLLQIVRIDVDDVAPDGGWRHERESQVFELCVDGQVLFVDCTLVDGVGTWVVDEFAQQNSVFDLLVKGFSLGINRQQMFQVVVVLQVAVDPFAKWNSGEKKSKLSIENHWNKLFRRLLFLKSHWMSCAERWAFWHSPQSLEVFLLRHDLFKRARDFLRLQVNANLFELIVVESSRRLQFLLVAELIDHHPNLVAGKFEADLIEGIFEFFELDKTTLFSDLKIDEKNV